MNTKHPVLDQLVQRGHLSTEQAEAIHEEHLRQGRPAHAIAVEQGYATEEAYQAALAHLLHARQIDLNAQPPDAGIQKKVPAEIPRTYGMVPLRADAHRVVFAVSDWPDPAATDDIAFILSRQVDYEVAPQQQIERCITDLYSEAGPLPPLQPVTLPDDLEHAANAAPVIQFVNHILQQAIRDHASDIHFEPFDNEFKIRCRVDGTLHELKPPSPHLALPIISRIKVLAGLDIAESRLPQDGRIQLDIRDRAIDFRVSTLPTQFGESVVLRVLDRSNTQLSLDRIGFPEEVHSAFRADLAKPNGILIVTGPTGSGKTTTLYAALQHINTPETKILTAEDPVEYDVEGLIQLPVRDRIGLGFAAALRAFLRQDPDVIMVGEIRDPETARVAVQASLTGHLVFSTLHTNDAAGAVTRLIDMEIEPYLIASTLEAVMAQRLLRKICPNCKTAYRPDAAELQSLGLPENQLNAAPFYHGTGCPDCRESGYAGRTAIFEYMSINDRLREAVAQRQSSQMLNRLACEQGMRTLREDGRRSILNGQTTAEEVIRYT